MEPLRYIIRLLRHSPAFVALVVLILGIGIGATTAAVNVAASVLLTPLPVQDDSRLVLVTKRLSTGSTLVPFSIAEMHAWSDASHALDAVGGVQYDGAWPSPAQIGDRTLTITASTVSGNFFSVLGARPVVGRLLQADDAKSGAEDVMVIGYGLWRRQFGGDPGVVGQRVRVSGRPATIVGVTPPHFAFPKGAEAWQPLVASPDVINEGWFSLVARLKPNATLSQAIDESSALLEQLRALRPVDVPTLRTRVMPLRDGVVGDAMPVVTLFVAAAFVLFVVGCINVVNLLLVRGTAREHEISVCFALGATRGRLIRRLLAETAVLVMAADGVGVLVAFWLQRALVRAAPADLPRLDLIGFDGRTLVVAFAASLVAAVLGGVVPALWTVRRSVFRGLRTPASSATPAPGQHIARSVLVAAQLAFALLVTIAAALLVRSLQQLQRADLGFVADRLSVVQVPLVGRAYADQDRRQQLFDRLVTRMESLPGIAAATPVLLRPFTGTDGWDASFAREGQRPEEAQANPGLHLEAVLPNYFSAMEIEVRGRAFNNDDRKGNTPVAIVSDSLARYAWRDSSALGKRLKFGGPDSRAPWMTVVGIVADVRYRDLKAPPPAIYVPIRQVPFPARFVLVRASVDHAPVLSMTQRALREIDPTEPVPEAASIGDLVATELAGPRFHMRALTLFSAVAVLLAAVGVLGVLGAFVAQRSREMALRIALGARVTDIRRLVISKVGWPVAVGLIAGTSAAWATMPLVRPMLFKVTALDARAFIVGWAILLLASVGAAFVPMRRASAVDPVTLLRSE